MIAAGWQRLDGTLVAAAALLVAVQVAPGGWPLWAWPLALLAPDLSVVGYVAGPRMGARIYNACHLHAAGLLLAVLGLASGHLALLFAGMLWLAHVGIDRALGFGLKADSGFSDTHLGRIGRK